MKLIAKRKCYLSERKSYIAEKSTERKSGSFLFDGL